MSGRWGSEGERRRTNRRPEPVREPVDQEVERRHGGDIGVRHGALGKDKGGELGGADAEGGDDLDGKALSKEGGKTRRSQRWKRRRRRQGRKRDGPRRGWRHRLLQRRDGAGSKGDQLAGRNEKRSKTDLFES